MTKRLDCDLVEHAGKQLAAVARRHVRGGAGPASAARAAIRETQALFPLSWRLGVQGEDADDFVEVWEVEHKRSEPIARISREPEPARRRTKIAHATKTSTQSVDPYRNSRQDVREAFEYMRDSFDNWPQDACFTERRKTMQLSKILSYDDYSSWGEIAPEELHGLKPNELLVALTAFRGPSWAAKAANWVADKSIPAVVVVDSKYGTAIADGRGRVNLAVGLNIPRLNVTLITDCK